MHPPSPFCIRRLAVVRASKHKSWRILGMLLRLSFFLTLLFLVFVGLQLALE